VLNCLCAQEGQHCKMCTHRMSWHNVDCVNNSLVFVAAAIGNHLL
jgi:hypothetical protein